MSTPIAPSTSGASSASCASSGVDIIITPASVTVAEVSAAGVIVPLLVPVVMMLPLLSSASTASMMAPLRVASNDSVNVCGGGMVTGPLMIGTEIGAAVAPAFVALTRSEVTPGTVPEEVTVTSITPPPVLVPPQAPPSASSHANRRAVKTTP